MHDIPHPAFLNAIAAILLAFAARAGADSPCRLAGYPQVAYRAEPCTFALDGQPGMTVTVSLPGMAEPARVDTFAQTRLEINVTLFQGGPVTLECGGRRFDFLAVTPGDDIALAAADRLLTADGVPVILLPEHKLPPPLDRRWETVRVLRETVDDSRPRVGSVTVVAGGWPWTGGPPPDDPVWKILPIGSNLMTGFFEIDRAIVNCRKLVAANGVPHQPAPELLGIAFSDRDLRLGHREEPWRLKLEWLLQALRRAAPGLPVFVTSLPLTPTDREQWPTLDDSQRVACQANGALFVNGFFHRLEGPLTLERFTGAVRPHLDKAVALP